MASSSSWQTGKINERMKYLLESGEDSDIEFLVRINNQSGEKKLFKAHKLILKNASAIFASQIHFEESLDEVINAPIEINDNGIFASSFNAMLHFIYTDDSSLINKNNIVGVYLAAKKLNPDAPAFFPQLPRPVFPHQSISNQNHFQYSIPNTFAYHSPQHFITNSPKFDLQSNQITKDDLKEHEALSILPKYLFDWEKNDEIDDNALEENEVHSPMPKSLLREFGIGTKNDVIGDDNIDQNEIGEAENSQSAHKTIPREEEGNVHLTDLKLKGEEGVSSQGQGVHLTPPKLNVEVEKSLQIQLDPTIQLKSELTPQKEQPKERGGDIDQREEVGSSGAGHKVVFREWEEDGNANFIDRQKLKVVTDQGAHLIPPKLNVEIKNSVKIGNNKVDSKPLKSESSSQIEQPKEREVKSSSSLVSHFTDQIKVKEGGSQGAHIAAPREGEEEESAHSIDRQKVKADSSNSHGAHLTPQKLNVEMENPIQAERSEVDPIQLKSESLPQKEQTKKAEDPNKKSTRKLNSKQRKREKQKQEDAQNAANQVLQHLYTSDRKDAKSPSSLITDKSYKEKLLDTAKISSSSSSSYRKEKQIHSHQPKQQQYSEQIAEKQQLSSHGEDISPHPQGNSGSFSTSHSTQKHQHTNRVDVGSSLTSDKSYMEKLMDPKAAKINTKERELRKKLNKIETNLLKTEKQYNAQYLKKEIDEMHNSLMNKFLKRNNNEKPETEKINEILEKIKERLVCLWTEYNVVLTIINEHWKNPDVKNQFEFELKRPYHFIGAIFYETISAKVGGTRDDIVEFYGIMRFTLQNMLMNQNFYRTMNIIINEVVVYERLNCFEVLSKNEKFAYERLSEQLEKIHELEEVLENKFTTQIKIRHFILNAFIEFEDLIQCINMLLKIQKRVNDAKPLPYLKSVYDKYWYIIYRDRFIRDFAIVRQYKFGQEKNQIYKEKEEKRENFKQINSIEPSIVVGIIKF